MKSKSIVVVMLLAFSLALPATAGAFSAPAYRTSLLHLINTYRVNHGRHALVMNPRLQQAACAHSTNMANHHLFSHTSSNGVTWQARIRYYGYRGRVIGENLAVGQISPTTALRMWVNSAPHRMNLLYAPYRAIGIGVVPGMWQGHWAYYLTTDFGAP